MKLQTIFTDTQNRVGSHKDFVRFTGSYNRATILQHFIYLHSNSARESKAFYNTDNEIAEWLAISPRVFRRVREWAVDKGYISKSVGHRPHTMFKTTWYAVNVDKIDAEFTEFYEEYHAKDDETEATSEDGNPFAGRIPTPSDRLVTTKLPHGHDQMTARSRPNDRTVDSYNPIDPLMDSKIDSVIGSITGKPEKIKFLFLGNLEEESGFAAIADEVGYKGSASKAWAKFKSHHERKGTEATEAGFAKLWKGWLLNGMKQGYNLTKSTNPKSKKGQKQKGHKQIIKAILNGEMKLKDLSLQDRQVLQHAISDGEVSISDLVKIGL